MIIAVDGYSLIEFVISLGISMVVFLFTVELLTNQQGLVKSLDEKLNIRIQSQILGFKIGRVIESAGGQGLAPWQAIYVENNCDARWVFPACQSNDRITLLTSKTDSSGTLYANRLVTSYEPNTGIVHLSPAVGVSCGSLEFLKGETVVIFFSNGEVMTRRITQFDENLCTLYSVVDKQSEVLTTTTNNSFSGAFLNIVKVITYFFDPNQKKILTFINKNNNDSVENNEITSQMNDIYSFQIALGYDFMPRDGSVIDEHSNSDEWLYNTPNESWNRDVFLTAQKSDLVSIKLSYITGVASIRPNSGSFQILDGATVNLNYHSFQKQSFNIVLRNLTSY